MASIVLVEDTRLMGRTEVMAQVSLDGDIPECQTMTLEPAMDDIQNRRIL